ncbi:RND family efflux transporter MFP subunit [Litorimonas taeanensis]|uniref:RND family efflux transporter MFP subunit n=1 Tax=Litorimonas taeanensis TaxID=568099 RepID=A0A420WLY1_9PROT|nr:efflux RND transporter periplasmic adaptor subunit [Litorimonas taeanensis]RKQ71989.1 RND family efflux transporter MFP subunit [Litorimonas taeanensis]
MQESEKAQIPFEKIGMSNFTNQNAQEGRRKLLIWRILGFFLPVFVIIVAIVGTIGMGALKPKPEEKKEEAKAVPVLTSLAQTGDVTLTVSAQGEVQPRTQINIVPQVSGQITYMSPKFIEGGAFKAGELLVRIDPAEYKLRVIQARAGVTQASTVVTREESEAEIAKRDWQELGRGGKPSALSLREPQLAEAKANLESAKAQLGEAELLLARTSIYAPFTGRVTMRHIDQGEYVTSGTKLGEVYATDVMDVRLPMSQNDLAEIGLTLGYHNASGDGIPVKLSSNIAGQYSEWTGHIVRTDSRFDNQSRVLFAYVEVKDPFGKGIVEGAPMAPGLFVNAEVEGKGLTDVTFIPRAALRGDNQVYVANDDGTLSVKTVTVVSSNRDRAVLSNGLTRGEAVITSPIRGVADGMKIELVKTGGAAETRIASGARP